MMTRERIELVAGSWQSIAPRHQELAQHFYQVLFRRHPELRQMFAHTNMAAQYTKFVGMVDAIIALRDEPRAVVRAGVELGRRHAGYGVLREHYAPAGSALLAALEQALGPALTPELREAWVEGYSVVGAIMCRGAAGQERRTA